MFCSILSLIMGICELYATPLEFNHSLRTGTESGLIIWYVPLCLAQYLVCCNFYDCCNDYYLLDWRSNLKKALTKVMVLHPGHWSTKDLSVPKSHSCPRCLHVAGRNQLSPSLLQWGKEAGWRHERGEEETRYPFRVEEFCQGTEEPLSLEIFRKQWPLSVWQGSLETELLRWTAVLIQSSWASSEQSGGWAAKVEGSEGLCPIPVTT